jgi:hypothetical protein
LRIRRARRGGFELHLPEEERQVLRALPGQMRELLGANDPSAGRLFPPAYDDDPERNAEYVGLVHDELVAGRLRALEVMEETIDAERLDEEQLSAWLGALNDLRLVLGTQLEVTEGDDGADLPDDDPQSPRYALYHYLGWLESQAVDALAKDLGRSG